MTVYVSRKEKTAAAASKSKFVCLLFATLESVDRNSSIASDFARVFAVTHKITFFVFSFRYAESKNRLLIPDLTDFLTFFSIIK